MEITKELLESRLAQLKAQQEQLIGQTNFVTGAIQLTEALIKELEADPPQESQPKVEAKEN